MRAFAMAFALVASTSQAATFTLSSTDLNPNKPIDDQFVYSGFGCTGKNLSPALQWSNPPAGTKSFALLVHDPDAPTGGAGWWHWLVLNLPAETRRIAQGAGSADGKTLAAGVVQLSTDFGAPGWGGPCPPIGDKAHRYIFTLYALKVDKLDLDASAKSALAGYMVNANAIGKASFTATYGRTK